MGTEGGTDGRTFSELSRVASQLKTDKIGQFKKIGKGRKSVNYLKIKEELICWNSPNKKKEKKCQFWKSLGRGYLSEQSYQKRKEKGGKVSFLEKFRKRLFVGTVPPKKKGEKVSILEKFRKRLFVETVPPKKKEKKRQFL